MTLCLFGLEANLMHLSVMLPLPFLPDKFLQIRVHRISGRDDSNHLTIFDHGDMAKAILLHHDQGVTVSSVGTKRDRSRCHDLLKRRQVRIKSFGKNAKERIAFSKNSDKMAVVHNQQGAKTSIPHQFRGIANALTRFTHEELLSVLVHDLSDGLIEHVYFQLWLTQSWVTTV